MDSVVGLVAGTSTPGVMPWKQLQESRAGWWIGERPRCGGDQWQRKFSWRIAVICFLENIKECWKTHLAKEVREQKARRKATQPEGKFRLRGRIRKRPEGRGDKSQRGEKRREKSQGWWRRNKSQQKKKKRNVGSYRLLVFAQKALDNQTARTGKKQPRAIRVW